MENKIQELTDKIYREGVEKGNQEAQRLIAEAQEKADAILAKANEEAAAIVSEATKKAGELADNTRTEMCQMAQQSKNALQSEIANVITNEVVKASVSEVVENKDFLGNFLVALASKWTTEEAIVIETKDEAALKAFFAAKAKELLDSKVSIKEVNGLKTLFTIKPESGAYKVEFGQEEFENYFKSFLRPQLIEMLF